jgi:signal transduction histidine kinase
MNLLVNATQAIEGPGEIKIHTYAVDSRVVVEIVDTGKGIPREDRNRIFDPGFTTKGVRVGTGLGLAIVHRIIEEHDGRIDVDSEVGRGSTFRVSLPQRRPTEDFGLFPI